MSLGCTVMLGIGVCLGSLLAQDCPPVARVLPNGTLAGTMDATSCQLGGRTPYAPYRLDLPVRGQIKIELSGNTGDFSVTLRDASGIQVDSGAGLLRPIEAGSYTLLVSGRAAGQTGSYTVNTSFTSEPGMLCSNFTNIGGRQTVAGKLPGSGCLAPDGTPYEAYTLTTDGAGTLTVAVASQDFTPVIAVRSIDGRPLSLPSASPLNVVLTGDSQYLVLISSADASTGAYQIANTFQTADNETCLSRKTLADSDSDTNAISAASCFVTIAGSGDQSYYNYYDFTLSGPGLVSVSAASGDFTATLNLLDAAGNALASNSGGGGSDAQDPVQNSVQNNVQSSLRVQLPAGSYRLQIFSDLPSGGNYTLKYTFQAGNPQPCTAGVLNFGDLLNSVLSDASCRTSIGLSDLYTLTLPSPGTVDLEIDSGMFDSILAIRDGKDNLIVRDDDVNGLSVAHVTADLPAGVYTVVGAATSGAGNYQLTARFTAHDIPACTFAQSLDLNGGFIQRLGPHSCIAANGQPVDYYTFTLPADSLVLAVMTSSEVDGYLTLYDAKGNVLRNDDNTYGSGDPLIVQYLPAGTYKLAARGASSTPGGLYQVDLRTVAGTRPPFCTPKATVTAGATVTGVITYTGCQYTDNSFADLYPMNLTADASVDLRLDSSEFDAYLVLLDSTGAVIDEDDDSGGNTNARITRDLPAGTYFMVVKPFGDYTSHGAYTLVTKTGN
jgi:Bacterial pre-peptidase C-terminal domain